MNGQQEGSGSGKKFAGIEVPSDLKRKNFFVMYLANFFMACLMSVPSIMQPAFLKEIINIPPEQAGSINSGLQNMSQVATVLFVGLVGVLSDKVGRKILAIIGFIVCGVFYILFYFTKDISLALGITSMGGEILMTFGVRFIIGIGLILGYPQFITMVADYTFRKDRGKGMALHGVTMALGTMLIFGVLAQIAKKTGLSSLFYISGALGFLGAFISRVWLVDRMPKEKAKTLGIKEIWNVVSKNLSLKVSYVLTFIARPDVIVVATLFVLWAVYTGDSFGTPMQATARGGLVLMLMSLFSLIAYPIVGVLLDRWGRVPVIITTLLMGGAGFCVTAFINNPFSPLMFIVAFLLGAGTYGVVPGAQVLAADASPKPMLGSILGGLNTMSPLGILLFLQVGGYLFDKVGYWSPFAFKGIANLACAVWIIVIRKRLILSGQETGSAASGEEAPKV